MVWSVFESQPELAHFAKLLLTIIINQAGCEQVFSDLKVKQTQCCNRLGLRKLAKMTKVSMDFISCILIKLTIHSIRSVLILRLNISHSGLQRLAGSTQSIN